MLQAAKSLLNFKHYGKSELSENPSWSLQQEENKKKHFLLIKAHKG